MCISFTSFTRTCHLVGRSWGAFVSSGIPGVWRWGQRRRWLCLPPPGKVARRVAPGALAADLPSQWSSPRVLPTLHCQETGSGRALGLSEQAGSPWSPGHSQGCQWKRGRRVGGTCDTRWCPCSLQKELGTLVDETWLWPSCVCVFDVASVNSL